MTGASSPDECPVSDSLEALITKRRVAAGPQTEMETRSLLKALASKNCPSDLLLWAAMCGTMAMKKKVAANPFASQLARDALMMDVEHSPHYVFSILAHAEVLQEFLLNVFGPTCPFLEASSFEDVVYATLDTTLAKQWRNDVPKSGACETVQAELVRITQRFGRTLNYGVAYQLGVDEEMFVTLQQVTEQIPEISTFNRNILGALLRWSQLRQRSSGEPLPPSDFERYDPVLPVIEAYLQRFPSPVPFSPHGPQRIS